MFIELKSIQVKEGYSEQVVNRFSQEGPLEKAPGFVDQSILVKQVRRGEEEVLLLIRWESEEAWKNWEKSEAHLELHRQGRAKGQPDFVIGRGHGLYDLKAVKRASPEAP
ncbi:antibiotic biosynthesis monooxygenase family protein [Gorillibacterium sp. sgz5001074]|uniref:antibiotic biosynthesis monooxygenase family protein n=1 Tax=Gorillibacterium sp. sgz5001074 TaxID=3446695 RepID=UPI003F67EB43